MILVVYMLCLLMGGEGRYLSIVCLDADEMPPNVPGETACNIVKLAVMFVVGYCNQLQT